MKVVSILLSDNQKLPSVVGLVGMELTFFIAAQCSYTPNIWRLLNRTFSALRLSIQPPSSPKGQYALVAKRLGTDTAWTADHNWSKGYSTPVWSAQKEKLREKWRMGRHLWWWCLSSQASIKYGYTLSFRMWLDICLLMLMNSPFYFAGVHSFSFPYQTITNSIDVSFCLTSLSPHRTGKGIE